jgi:hypothetical protein
MLISLKNTTMVEENVNGFLFLWIFIIKYKNNEKNSKTNRKRPK